MMISKINILIRQGRYDEAAKLLKELLSQDPNNVSYLSLLSEVYLNQDKLEEALQLINNAIGLEPQNGDLFYVKSRIKILQDDFKAAEKNINQSIGIDPYDADYYAILANIQLVKKEFEKALSTADQALSIDAEHILALNIRSSALIKLDKSAASFETIEGALREDPNNAYTHANYGWGLLENGNHKKALIHFKASLKNDPNFDYAQAGMMEALKANNPIYRFFLKFSFWMSNLTSKYQWAVVLGFYFGFRALTKFADNHPEWQPYLNPVIFALAIFAFSTWIITPISNLFLRFNTYGKYLLNKNQIKSSNFVAISFAILLIGLLLYFILQNDGYLAMAIFGFAMMVPFSAMFTPSKYKNAFLIYGILMSVIGVLSIGVTFLSGALINLFSMIFLIGFIAFQWIANFFMIQDGNK